MTLSVLCGRRARASGVRTGGGWEALDGGGDAVEGIFAFVAVWVGSFLNALPHGR